MKLTLRLAILALLFLFTTQADAALTAKEVGIVYNNAFAGSEDIAKAYSEARGIDEKAMLALSTSVGEEIARATYDADIKAPVEAFLKEHTTIRALVLCRGVPLKIKETDRSNDGQAFIGRDFAAVDSELCTLRLADVPDVTKQFANPVFNKSENITAEDKIVIVCRLDGPSTEIALGLIEKAILAESFGISGGSVLDTGPANPGYKSRDLLMEKIAGIWKEAKLPFVHDDLPEVVDLSTQKESPLHYNGWYIGNPGKWKGPVRFRTGSVAVHLHSFSAATLRDVKKNWCAPLLNWGATATIGTVYEPYTIGFPQESIYWDRLCKGYSFGEAGLIANQHISWQAVFIGDPLYTPYAKNRKETIKTRRKLILEMLKTSKESKAIELAKGDTLLITAFKHLRAYVDDIESALKKDQKLASRLYGELEFLTRGMGLEAALGDGMKKLNKALEKEFSVIKKALKKRVNDTEAYSKARNAWKGLPVAEDIEKFHTSLVKDQEKAAKAWFKKAERGEKSTPYDAWKNANQASLCEFAPKIAEQAAELAKRIHDANKDKKRYLRTANRELKNILASAKRVAAKKPEDAIESLRHAVRDYPKCGPRNNCDKELKRLRGEKGNSAKSKK